MARTDTLPHFLTDVADAIRTAEGSSETIQASDFDTRIEALSGGSTTPKTIDELRQITTDFGSYLNSLLDNYEAYTSEAITIYTPDSLCTNFMIQKRSNNKYRIVWSKIGACVVLQSNTLQSFTCITNYEPITGPILYHDFFNYNFNMLKSSDSLTGQKEKGYYSNEFSTLEDLITNLKSSTGNITYTPYTSGVGYSGVLDENWTTPITNIPVLQNDYSTPVINGKILSHNLTILAKE